MVIKKLRVAAGLTQAKLAAEAGINVRQIQKIESGEIRLSNITLKNAKAIADVLQISVDSLLE